jgi:hypothetical protein
MTNQYLQYAEKTAITPFLFFFCLSYVIHMGCQESENVKQLY